MSRSAAPPNAGRAVPVPAVYYALLAEIERHRLRFGIPMWKLDDAAGGQDGYYSKALRPDTPSGRMAVWTTLQKYTETLFPEGFSVKIEPRRDVNVPASTLHKLSIKFSGARYDFEAREDWMKSISARGASKGGRARAEAMSERRRKASARKAGKASALARKIAKRGKEIEKDLSQQT